MQPVSSYHKLFTELDQYLFRHQHYWRYLPFQLMTDSFSDGAPWAEYDAKLHHAVADLSDSQVAELRQDGEQLQAWITQYIPSLPMWLKHIRFPDIDFPLWGEYQLNASIYNGIPGRKVAQLNAMANASLHQHQGTRWLEWCAGKGYLGRIVAAVSKQPVVSFEYQSELCQSGQAAATLQQLPIQFVQGDAFSISAKAVVTSDMHALALHACGDLHVRLLQYASEKRLPAITIAPCCYHLTQSNQYQPLSKAYQLNLLDLNQEELRIPLQETVTGGQRVKRHRQLEMTYRLGFDEIVKRERNEPHYVPVPSIKKSQLAEGFDSFCYWAAEQKGYRFNDIDFKHYLALAEGKYSQMEKLALVQQSFFPLVEAWIILDKVLYLEEQGYEVTVSRFCEKSITPRNILIHAELVKK